jgi:EmrB/QacA subfamily drug resistance transporter
VTNPQNSATTAPPGSAAHPRRWAILAVVAAAQFVVLLDSTVVNVALPSIGADLGASTSDQQWVVDVYLLTFAGLLLFGGRCADLLGRRRVFLVGLTVFAVSSLACGLADSPTALIVARAFQGAGAAVLSPSALSIVVTTFTDPRERRTALSAWGGLAVLGGTFGVVFGGLVVATLSWSWAFFVNLPIALAAFVAALVLIPADPARGAAPRRSFDAGGALIATAALLLLIHGMIGTSEHGWSTVVTLGPIAGALLLFAVLALVESRVRDPLMPPRLFRRAGLLVGGVGLLLTWAGQISVFYMVSVYQQRVLGFTAFEAGLGMLAMGLPALAVVAVLPRLIGRVGAPGAYVVGSALVLVGTALLVRLPVDGSFPVDLLPGLAIMGFGLPCCFVSLTALGVSAAPPADSGVASGLLNTFSQTGAALGVATLVTVAATRTADLAESGRPVADSLTAGFRFGFGFATAVAAANLLLGLLALVRARRRAAATST